VHKKLNYYDPTFYEMKTVSGNATSCMKVFYHDTQIYPTMLYGTHIWSKNLKAKGVQCEIVIKRFKTKELCKIHTQYPCSYIRKGKTS